MDCINDIAFIFLCFHPIIHLAYILDNILLNQPFIILFIYYSFNNRTFEFKQLKFLIKCFSCTKVKNDYANISKFTFQIIKFINWIYSFLFHFFNIFLKNY